MWKKIKNSWKSRTIWTGGLLAVLAAMQANIGNLAAVLSEQAYGIITFALAIVIVILRFDTNKGLHEK